MPAELEWAQPADGDRRSFLKKVVIGLAAVGAYAVLARRPFGGAKRARRSITANLPGEGSIFQPRGDGRSR